MWDTIATANQDTPDLIQNASVSIFLMFELSKDVSTNFVNISSEHLIVLLLTDRVFNISVPSRLIDTSKLTQEWFDGNGGLSAVISSVIEAPFYVPFSNGEKSKRFVVSIF